jgi:hypothetical protein
MSQDNEPPREVVIDGHAEEISSEQPPAAPQANALTLAPRPPAEHEVLPLDPDRVVEGMRQYQRLLRDLLEPSDWQTEDKNGNQLERPFLKKSGWRKIARAFNLSFERVHSRVERDEDGTPVRAEVWIRAVAPNGQFGDGDGYCSADEGRFKSRSGRQKLENDLRATACMPLRAEILTARDSAHTTRLRRAMRCSRTTSQPTAVAGRGCER